MKRSKNPNVTQINLVIFVAEVLYASLVASDRAVLGQIPSVRYDKAECAYKFVGVLLAVCTPLDASNPTSSRIAFGIIENFLKALGNSDWRSRKVRSWVRHRDEATAI